jgi:hypothetical protein
VEVSILISSKSDKAVQLLDLSVAGKNPSAQDAPFTGNLAINSELKPFTSDSRNLTITATKHAPFTQNKLLLMLRYSWHAGTEPVTSMQSATITVNVQRPFEDEAKGFPGGTAAFLYFLLPIIPALLSYQLVERYRKGEGWRIPTFSSDQIVPAFFLAVVLSFVIVAVGKRRGGIDYSNSKVFASVLGISLGVGAFIPFVKLLIERGALREMRAAQSTYEKYSCRPGLRLNSNGSPERSDGSRGRAYCSSNRAERRS